MIPDYALLSPVGSTRLYALEGFFKHIDRFSHKPAEIIVCVDSGTGKEMDRLGVTGLARLYANERLQLGMLPRIADAREKLRRYFLRHTKLDWALWLDSDILAPPELPEGAERWAWFKQQFRAAMKRPWEWQPQQKNSGKTIPARGDVDYGEPGPIKM